MITGDPLQFLKAFRKIDELPYSPSVTMRKAMLVDPTGFRISSQSAEDNHYMDLDQNVDLDLAHEQHRNVVTTIEKLGVEVVCFSGQEGFEDGIYPNNVFATKPGKLIVGKMFHEVRCREATRPDIRSYFLKDLSYELEDLSSGSGVCELTGALIVDHARNIGYCGLTSRANEAGCEAMHAAFGLNLTFKFDLRPEEYHTNIVLSLFGGKGGVIYPGAFEDLNAPNSIVEAYAGRLIQITEKEKNLFVGNCLAITPQDILFSLTAIKVMSTTTRKSLESQGFRLHSVDVSELEKGGGFTLLDC